MHDAAALLLSNRQSLACYETCKSCRQVQGEVPVLQEDGHSDDEGGTDDEAGIKRQNACSAIECGSAHQHGIPCCAQEEVYGNTVKEDLVAEDSIHDPAARSEAVHEVKRDIEGDCGDKESGQQHEPNGSRGMTQHDKKPPDATASNDGIPDQNEDPGYIALARFHGVQTLSIEKL